MIADCIAFTTTEACATGPITLDPAILVGVWPGVPASPAGPGVPVIPVSTLVGKTVAVEKVSTPPLAKVGSSNTIVFTVTDPSL